MPLVLRVTPVPKVIVVETVSLAAPVLLGRSLSPALLSHQWCPFRPLSDPDPSTDRTIVVGEAGVKKCTSQYLGIQPEINRFLVVLSRYRTDGRIRGETFYDKTDCRSPTKYKQNVGNTGVREKTGIRVLGQDGGNDSLLGTRVSKGSSSS